LMQRAGLRSKTSKHRWRTVLMDADNRVREEVGVT
jgi:hypothetical protein